MLVCNLFKYKNPVIYYSIILQYGDANSYDNIDNLCKAMHSMAKDIKGSCDDDDDDLSISVTFNQQTFNRKLSHVFTDTFITMIPTTKRAQVTQSKHYPRPSCYDSGNTTLVVTHPIGWKT